VAVVLLAAALLGGWLIVRPMLAKRGNDTGVDPSAQPREVAPPGEKDADEKQNIRVFQEAKNSVVHITTYGLRRNRLSRNAQAVPAGSGSGFVWSQQGHIVTNYHVIQNADAAQVTLLYGNDGKQRANYQAQIVGVQPDMDLAVLVINAPKDQLKPIKVGSSHDLQVGQNVYAIGNPFGLDWSLTKGIISALDREIESVAGTPIEHVIQTDAAINPGNSGGPLLDSSGRLIGVTTAIYSPSGANAGIGFAIPVDEVNPVVTRLIQTGKTEARRPPPRLGVNLAPDTFARNQGVAEGALILEVTPNSPADQAGLRSTVLTRSGRVQELGDVIVAIDGKPVRTAADLFAALKGRQAGERVTLTILRDGQRITAQMTLQR
jgi:S1-C subfamily serine protease